MIHQLVELVGKSNHQEAIILTLIGVYVLVFFFSLTLFRFLNRLPKENQIFPSWLVWFFLIPWIALIFRWMMLPFGIPRAIKATYPKNQDIIEYANALFRLGLAQVIITTSSFFIPEGIVQDGIAIFGVLLWIIYWIKILRFEKTLSRSET